MRRLTAWIGGTAAGIAAYRLWRRRPRAASEPSAAAEPDSRADELRVKLAESRTAEPVAEETPPPPEPEPESPEERRRQVHEEGRAALDQMKSDEPG